MNAGTYVCIPPSMGIREGWIERGAADLARVRSIVRHALSEQPAVCYQLYCTEQHLQSSRKALERSRRTLEQYARLTGADSVEDLAGERDQVPEMAQVPAQGALVLSEDDRELADVAAEVLAEQ